MIKKKRRGIYSYSGLVARTGTSLRRNVILSETKDQTILYITDADQTEKNLAWFRQYKETLKEMFRQLEIYLTVIIVAKGSKKLHKK